MDTLRNMLEQARFYGAKSEPITAVEIRHEAPALGHRHVVVEVSHGAGSSLYQLLIDAADRDVLATSATALGQALASGTPAGLGQLHGSAEQLSGLQGREYRGEQSNTSLIFGDDSGDEVIIKYFRRLEAGSHPEVELLRAIPDCPNIAPLSGWITAELSGQTYVLAMIQEYVPHTLNAWDYALGFTPLNASFAPEAELIGRATGVVHRALAEAFPVDQVKLHTLAQQLSERLDSLLDRAPVLREFEDAARDLYRGLGSGTTPVQRIHGDLHLGQILLGEEDYLLIDFEGEPGRPLAQRHLPDSPLRDLAGLLRSLDYAAATGDASPEWVAQAGEGLLSGYGVTASPLLSAYVLDKALYEVAYETDHRPGWVNIPLEAVRRLLS